MRTRDDIEYLSFLIGLADQTIGRRPRPFDDWLEEHLYPVLVEAGIPKEWSCWEKIPEKLFWEAVYFLEDLIADKLAAINGGDQNYARLFLHFTPAMSYRRAPG